MKNVIILVSGMPGTGKTSFARWLSSKMHIPLVCYDHIKEKTIEITEASCENEEQKKLFGRFPYDFFWFSCEEIMRSSSMLIAEYFFADQMKETINMLIEKYHYQTINVHFDTSVETAHRRFHERNHNAPKIEGMRPIEIPFEQFVAGTKGNKDFRYGENLIYVDTTDFTTVSYESIAEMV